MGSLKRADGARFSVEREGARPAGLPLRSERLILRPFREADFSDVHEYASDPEVTRFLRWGPNPASETLRFCDKPSRTPGLPTGRASTWPSWSGRACGYAAVSASKKRRPAWWRSAIASRGRSGGLATRPRPCRAPSVSQWPASTGRNCRIGGPGQCCFRAGATPGRLRTGGRLHPLRTLDERALRYGPRFPPAPVPSVLTPPRSPRPGSRRPTAKGR